MAVQTITYDNKVTLNENSSIADINKCQASDMNEIKAVVNNNANLMGDVSTLNNGASSVVGAINNICVFPTTAVAEHVVGVTTDGQIAYARTDIFTSGWTVGGHTEIDAPITNFKDFLKYEAHVSRQDGNWQQIPATYTNYGISIYDLAGWGFRIDVASNYTGTYAITKLYITRYYTKTTD
jgi:hypothetical protein